MTSGTVLTGMVSSASPPTLSSHRVATATAKYPHRFVGFFVLNAGASDAPSRAERAFGELGLRCACLFPSLHRYPLTDERVATVFQIATGAMSKQKGLAENDQKARRATITIRRAW